MNFQLINERKRKKITQEQLCKEVGICRKTLSNIENGKDMHLTKGVMIKISKILEVDIQTLFFHEN